MDKSGIKKIFARTGTFVAALAVALVGGYILTPKNTRTVTLNSDDHEQVVVNKDQDVFDTFINAFVRNIGVTGENDGENGRPIYGLKVSSDDLTLKFPTKLASKDNVIKIGLDVDFSMRNLKDLDFSVALDVDYNNRQLPIQISYVDQTAYFGLKDLRVKCSFSDIEDLLPVFEQFFIYGEDVVAEGETQGGLGLVGLYDKVETTLNDFVSNLLGSADMSSMTSALDESKANEEGLHLLHETVELDNSYEFDLSILINKLEEKENDSGEKVQEMNTTRIDITIFTDKTNDLKIQKIVLGPMSFGDFTISGTLNAEFIENMSVYAPTNSNYAKYVENAEYVEVAAYKGWIKKIADFLNEDNQKFSLDFALDLSHTHGVTAENDTEYTNEIGAVTGSITADFSELIDLSELKQEPESDVDENGVGHNRKINLNDEQEEVEEESLIKKILDKTFLGVDVKLIGNTGEEYGNLSVKYIDGDAFISLNEFINNGVESSVMKAKVDASTINWFVNKAPSMLASLTSDSENSQEAVEEQQDSLFSFITDSSFVTGIKNQDYSVIMDLLKSIRNDREKIYIDLDLSSIGLGENAEVNLELNSSSDANAEILTLNVNNVELGSFNIGLEVKNDTSFSRDISLTEQEKTAYEDTTFLPTVFDQVSNILDTKQAGFAVSGSVLDNDNLGVKFSGKGQFDYGEKFGFGDLTIDQYKYRANEVWYSHKIALDVDNQGEDYTQNNARFVYGDINSNKNMKGRFTIQTFLDIFDVVKTFVKEDANDSKFTKFIAPILETLGLGTISDILDSEDYLRFAKNDILKEIKQYDEGSKLRITIGGEFFNLSSDIVLEVKFATNEQGEKTIDAISIPGMRLGSGESQKTIKLEIALKDYDAERVSPIDKTADFLNLSDIAVLLQLGINTTKMNYYQLSADIAVSALSFINIDFNLQVHIVVSHSNVKIYGIIEDSKFTTLGVGQSCPLTTTAMKSEFTFHTDESASNNDVGGYFDFKRTETVFERKGLFNYGNVDHIYHYRTTSKNLLEGNNLLTYLLVDFLGFKSSLLDSLGSLDLSGSSEEKAAGDFTNLFTETGFNYNKDTMVLKTGINLYEITGIDALRELELTISGKTIRDEEDNDIDVLSKAVVDLNVKASLVTLSVGATITLVNPNLTATDWSNAIETAYGSIVNVDVPASAVNDPTAYYTV